MTTTSNTNGHDPSGVPAAPTLISLPVDALEPCLARFLTPGDLAQLARTCRAARDFSLPHLYRHLIIPSLPSLPLLHTTLSTRPDLARLVSTITAGAPMMLDLAQFDFRQLLELKKLVPGSMVPTLKGMAMFGRSLLESLPMGWLALLAAACPNLTGMDVSLGMEGLFLSLGFLDLAIVLRKRQAWFKGPRVYPLTAVMAYDPLLQSANGHPEKTPYFVTFIDFKRKLIDVTNEQPLPMLSALIVYPWFEVVGSKDKQVQSEWRIRNAVIAQQGGADRPQNDAWFARGKEVEVLEKSGIRMHEDHVYDLCAASSGDSAPTPTVTASPPKSKRNPRAKAKSATPPSTSPIAKLLSPTPCKAEPAATPGLTGSVSAFMATSAGFSTLRSNPRYPQARVTRIQIGGEAAWIQKRTTDPTSLQRSMEKYSINMLGAFTKVLPTPWTSIRHLEFTESYFLGILSENEERHFIELLANKLPNLDSLVFMYMTESIRHVLGVLDPLLRRLPSKGRALRDLHLMAPNGRGGDGKCWMRPKDKTPLDALRTDGTTHLKRLLVHDGNKSNRWDTQIMIHPGMMHGLTHLSLTQCSMHVVTPTPSPYAQSFPPVNGDPKLPTIHLRHLNLPNLTSLCLDAAKLYSSFTPSASSQWGAIPYMLPTARNLQYLSLINMELMPVPAAPKFTPDHLLATVRKYPNLKQMIVRAAPFTRAHFEYLARALFHPPPVLSPLPAGFQRLLVFTQPPGNSPPELYVGGPHVHALVTDHPLPNPAPGKAYTPRASQLELDADTYLAGMPEGMVAGFGDACMWCACFRESMPFQIGARGAGIGAGSLDAKAWMSLRNPAKVVCKQCAVDEVEWVGGKGERGWRRVRLVEVLDEMPFLGIETWGLLM